MTCKNDKSQGTVHHPHSARECRAKKLWWLGKRRSAEYLCNQTNKPPGNEKNTCKGSMVSHYYALVYHGPLLSQLLGYLAIGCLFYSLSIASGCLIFFPPPGYSRKDLGLNRGCWGQAGAIYSFFSGWVKELIYLYPGPLGKRPFDSYILL